MKSGNQDAVYGDEDSRLLKTKEVAEQLKLSVATLQNWRSVGIGPPYVKLGHSASASVRYRVGDLAKWHRGLLSLCGIVTEPGKTNGLGGSGLSDPAEDSNLLTNEEVSRLIGLGKDVLQSWRGTDVGPPYIRLTGSASSAPRYRLKDVLQWQRTCPRIAPDDWQPTGSLPGESVAGATDRIQWLAPGRAAMAIQVAIPTMTAWRKHEIGLPFILIGGGGTHEIMYDRGDIDAFISRRQADPSIVPVFGKKGNAAFR